VKVASSVGGNCGDYNDNENKKADGSDMECIMTAMHSGKCQVWPPIDHFERLIEEACLNNAYAINYKLKDCGMMNNFMTSGSFTRDREPEEDLGESNAMPFPGEDVGKMVYEGGTSCLT
jgi:hypothetical protein